MCAKSHDVILKEALKKIYKYNPHLPLAGGPQLEQHICVVIDGVQLYIVRHLPPKDIESLKKSTTASEIYDDL